MAPESCRVTEPWDQRRKLRRGVKHCAACVETSQGWTTARHLAGGRAEAGCIVGDVVSLPGLLFDKVVAVELNARKESETLEEAPPSFSCRDVELDVHRFLDVPAVGRNLHHHSGLKAERHRCLGRMKVRENTTEHTDKTKYRYDWQKR